MFFVVNENDQTELDYPHGSLKNLIFRIEVKVDFYSCSKIILSLLTAVWDYGYKGPRLATAFSPISARVRNGLAPRLLPVADRVRGESS